MMSELQKRVVIAFAENDMRIDRTAAAMMYSRGTIQYYLDKIRRDTGLNPRCFFDLIKLYKIAKGEEKE